MDQGKEDASLLNSMAWFSLYTGKVSDTDVATATRATQMERDNAAILHTLACVYAETGKTKEAHDLGKPTQTPTPLRIGATSLKLSGMEPQAFRLRL